MTDRQRFQLVRSFMLSLVVLIALLVMGGWFSQQEALTRLRPTFPPMHINTALLLLLGALGLLAATWNRPRVAAALGWLMMALAGATLAEFLLDRYQIHFALDELFARDFMQVKPAIPGRMAPNTAVCLSLMGLILAMGTVKFRERMALTRLAMALLVLALSGVALLGYFTSIQEAYRWGTFTGMVVHTAVCLLILGGVAAAEAMDWIPTRRSLWENWLPVALGLAVAVPSVMLWYMLWSHEDQNLRRAVVHAEEEVGDRVRAQFEARQRELLYVASALGQGDSDTPPAKPRWWPTNSYPGRLGMGVYRLGAGLRWLEGSDEKIAPGTPKLDRDPQIPRVVEESIRVKRFAVSDPIKLTGDRIGFIFCVPLFEGQVFDHAIISLYDAKELFDRSLNPKINAVGYGVKVLYHNQLVYRRENEPESARSDALRRTWSQPEESPWEIQVWPVEAISQLQSPLPEVCLVAGLVMAVLTGVATYHRQNALRQAASLGQANTELTELSRSLDKRVEQRTNDLARANAELEVRSHEMESFVYSVSHDLKSPIVTCRGFLSLLREQVGRGNLQGATDAVMRVDRALDRMSQCIDDLLELSRIGRVAGDPELIDMNLLLGRLAEELTPRFTQRGVTLRVEPGLPSITADKTRIAEAFENLLTNALKYGCSGEHPAVTVGARAGDHQTHFFVADNGQGISPAYHEKIFQLFQRLDRTQEGTGIGLTIVHRIMQVHGGRAWVESQPGKGATFLLAFPQNTSAGVRTPAADHPTPTM